MNFTLILINLLLMGAYSFNTSTPSPQDDGIDVESRIKKLYGNGIIEYYNDKKNRISSCGNNTAPDGSQCYWFFLDPRDGDRDAKQVKNVYTDRARIDIRFIREQTAAKEGEIWNHKWYFWVKPDVVLTNTSNFFHIHQIKSVPANDAAKGAIITFSLAKKIFRVNHGGCTMATSAGVLAEIPVEDVLGEWVYADQTLKAGTNGWYKLTLTDAASGKVLLQIPQTNLDMWRGGRNIHPKMGIYRKHGNWDRTFLAFSEWQFTQVKEA